MEQQRAPGDWQVEIKSIAGTVLETILGMEGAGSAATSVALENWLNDRRQLAVCGTMSRSPTDPVTLCSALAMALLTNRVASGCRSWVLISMLLPAQHLSMASRLALDLVEEFRPIIVDSLVLTC